MKKKNEMAKIGFIASLSLILILILIPIRPAFSQKEEEVQYKKFKFENASCDVGIVYAKREDIRYIGVSAIAIGKGAEFRKWDITDIKLNIDQERIKPDRAGKFYVRKESFFRIPAAVLFAAIGTQVDVSGSDLEKGIAKAGMAVGLGLLVLQAQGEITGQRCVFNLNKEVEDKIVEGRDAIEITLENQDIHEKNTIRIGIAKVSAEAANVPDFGRMTKGELERLVDNLGGEVADLERKQEMYRYGVDAEYDDIQRNIERLQAERGMAYKAWFERGRK